MLLGDGLPTYDKIDEKEGLQEDELIQQFNDPYEKYILTILTFIEAIAYAIMAPLFRIFEGDIRLGHSTYRAHEKPIFGLIRFYVKIFEATYMSFDSHFVIISYIYILVSEIHSRSSLFHNIFWTFHFTYKVPSMQRFIGRVFTNSNGLGLIDIGESISLGLAF